MKTVGAREANQRFSALLLETERSGEPIEITRRGKVVARLVPVNEAGSPKGRSPAIRAWILRYSRPSGGRSWSRDELYEEP